jgi:methionyl aminopeptidase
VHERQRGHLPRHPGLRPLEDGDIVNVDITAFLDGVHGDTNRTYLVGDVDEESRLLVERTREATLRGSAPRDQGAGST